MSAAIIATNTSYLVLAFIPPIIWLVFYLREDRNRPEPKYLLLLAFAGGMGSALFAILGECLFIGLLGGSCAGGINDSVNLIYLFQ